MRVYQKNIMTRNHINLMVNLGKTKNLRRLVTMAILIMAPVAGVTALNECAGWITKVASLKNYTDIRITSDTTSNTGWQSVILNQTLYPGNAVHIQLHRLALAQRYGTTLTPT